MFALFVLLQDFAGPFDDAAGEAGEARDFDAVAFAGAAGFDVAEENNFVGSFLYRHVDVFDRGEKIGEFGEFVVVGSEESAGAGVFLQMFDDGPGDGEAVEGGGATADLVEKDEAGRCAGEDAGDFAHLTRKVERPRARLSAAPMRGRWVGERSFGLARGNEGAHLRHQDDQRGLAEIG